MTYKMPRRGRGALHMIAGLLVISAMVRIGTVGAAMAEASDQTHSEPEPVETHAADAHDVEPTNAELGDQDTSALLVAFQQREARLAAREAQLIDRLQALRIAEAEFARQIVALEEAEKALSATIALADVAAEADLGQLVEVYENMKPKDAAELFQQMSPQFAAGFLGMMNPESAAQIMTLVPPDVSYSISVVLAGRNANVPTQ